jgi:branched-subunit amino acid ABC-type transport system permease component
MDLGIGLATAVGLGSTYALMAMSFSLVVSASGIFNFALESVVSLASILAYFLIVDWSIPQIGAAIIVILSGTLAGFVMYLVVGLPFEGRSNDYSGSIAAATIGLALAIDSLANLLFGSTPQGVPSYVSQNPIVIAGVPVQPLYLVMFLVLIVVVIVGEFFFRRTRAGLVMRAVQHDRTGASLLGIANRKVIAFAFALSGLLAAGAGFLLAPVTQASSTVGTSLLIPGFAAMAIGGFGSFQGAAIGGLVIGLIEGVGPFLVNINAIDPLVFLAMVVILLWRPSGLVGVRGSRSI